jgi:hypothetical protein
VVIIAAPDGSGRACDAKCYGAIGPVCCCICRGANHGLGRLDAIARTRVRDGLAGAS